MTRGLGRPRKEAAKLVEPPQLTGEPSTPCSNDSRSAMEKEEANPNSHELGKTNPTPSPDTLKQSWTSTVQSSSKVDHRLAAAQVNQTHEEGQ